MAVRPSSGSDTSRLFSFTPGTEQQVLGGGLSLPSDLFALPSLFPAGAVDVNGRAQGADSRLGGGYVQPIANPASPATYQTAPRGALSFGLDQPQRLTGAVLGMPAGQAASQYPVATQNILSTFLGNMQRQQPQGTPQGSQIVQTQWGPMPWDQFIQRAQQQHAANFPQQTQQPTQQPQQPARAPSASYAPGIDQFLAGLSGNVKYLQNVAENKGNPVDVLPAWNAAIEAMKRNVAFKGADLAEYFNRGGNYFSTSFGNAATDFYSQTAKDQNALLAQMLLASQEGAQGRNLEASRQLAQYGFAGPSQLSSQAFQATQGDQNRMLQALSQMAGGSDQAAQLMAQMGGQGAMALLGGSTTGAQSLFGSENNAASQMYQSLMGMIPGYLNYDLSGRGQGLQGAGMLSNLLNQNLQTGSQLGGQQYGTQAQMINALQQNWNQQQPWNNPLLSMIMQGATGYSPMFMPQYTQSQWPGLLGGLGGIMGSLPGLFKMLGWGG